MTRFLRKAMQNLKRDRHIPEQGDMMEILERQDEEEIWESLGRLGFGQEGYFIAVSCGERRLELTEAEGISLRLGRKQWGYILKNHRFSIPERELPNFVSGIGYMEKAVEGREIYEGFEECTARAYQYFVDGEKRLCSRLDETGANHWLDNIQEKVQGNQWGSVSCLLEEIGRSAGRDFTVRSALRLCNLILSNPSLRDEESDFYVYSVEQLVNTYGSFQEMLRRLRQSLDEQGSGEEEGGDFTNATFMKLMRYINENYKKDISLAGAAQTLHMNANYVSQFFKRESGSTFVRYVNQKRLEDAKELLTNTKKNLTDIALEVGFNDAFHFTKTFKKFTGMTPGQYRAGG